MSEISAQTLRDRIAALRAEDAGHFAQWHNRDTGYGICRRCVDWIKNRRPFGHDPITPDEFHRNYGVEGVHYASSTGKYAITAT